MNPVARSLDDFSRRIGALAVDHEKLDGAVGDGIRERGLEAPLDLRRLVAHRNHDRHRGCVAHGGSR